VREGGKEGRKEGRKEGTIAVQLCRSSFLPFLLLPNLEMSQEDEYLYSAPSKEDQAAGVLSFFLIS
jgi:hypothetical protein